VAIRKAKRSDLEALVAIEIRCFTSDRLSRRSLRYFLAAPNAAIVLAVFKGIVAGYALVSFRRGSAIARLYSIATDPDFRGRKMGLNLLKAAEKMARLRRARTMRLEVRGRNHRAIALYEREGYRRFGRIEDYYEDGATALRYEKCLTLRSKHRLDSAR
jgi:ribosomal protein S18 acetylase RimI-like enzyme